MDGLVCHLKPDDKPNIHCYSANHVQKHHPSCRASQDLLSHHVVSTVEEMKMKSHIGLGLLAAVLDV